MGVLSRLNEIKMQVLKSALYLIGVLLILPVNLPAQVNDGGTVSGSVSAKSDKKPVGFASVIIFHAIDSSIVTGATTGENGKFVISHIPDGRYYLVVSCIGYIDTSSGAFAIDSMHQKQDLGRFLLAENALRQKDIVVTGEKAVYNTFIDRKVYNVTKDMMSQSGTASDLLQNVPSVTVDIEGNVSLRGSENVLIMINGHTSPLMGKNRATVLQQMPANSIERIEVITNPSAKYKPEGTSGIINIVLKEKTQEGWSGSLSANAGMDSRINTNLNLNYNPGPFNLYGSYGVRKDSRSRNSVDSRQYIDQSSQVNSFYNQDSKGHARPLSNIATLGIDYTPGKSDRMGVSGDYFIRSVRQSESSRNIFRDGNLDTTSFYDRIRRGDEDEDENEANAYYEHSFPKEDHKLRLEGFVSGQPEKENNHYTNIYYTQPQIPFDDQLFDRRDRQYQLTAEYSNPLTENSTLEAGFEQEINKQDIKNIADIFDTTGQRFITDSTKTNRFIFNERISALYATLEHSFGKVSVLAGLRFEYAHNNSHLMTIDSTVNKNYTSFYPSCHLGYKLGENSQLQLNYSKRTRRPEGEDLNPFPEYRDLLNIESGNPNLLPEYIHSVELGWQLQNKRLSITPSIYYRYEYNGFTRVTEPYRDSVLLTTMKNLSSDRSAGVELILNGSVGNYLDVDVSTNAFYNTIDASNIGFSDKKSVASWSGTFNITYKFRPTTILQTNTYYRSARLTPQGKNLANFVSNFGMRQDLFDEKLSLILTVSDLFKSRIQKMQLRTAWITGDSRFSRDSQTVFLGGVYHFGKTSKKDEKKSLEFDNGQ